MAKQKVQRVSYVLSTRLSLKGDGWYRTMNEALKAWALGRGDDVATINDHENDLTLVSDVWFQGYRTTVIAINEDEGGFGFLVGNTSGHDANGMWVIDGLVFMFDTMTNVIVGATD